MLVAGIIVFLAVVYILGAPRFMQKLYSKLLFMPHRERGDKEDFITEFGELAKFHRFKSGKFELRGCFLACPESKQLVLISMGRDGDIERRLELLRVLVDLNINVFVYEYPGFGKSTGYATIKTVLDSGINAVDYVVEELGFSPKQIFVFGESMGVCTALHQLSKHKFAGAILKSGFYSLERVSKERYPILRIYPSIFYPNVMNNAQILQTLECPVLIIHGAKDRMVCIEQARGLNSLSSESELIVLDESRHAYMPDEDKEHYRKAIVQFLIRLKQDE